LLLRKAAVAGSWYPGGKQDLSAEVDGYLGAVAEEPPPGRLVALVSPHAGLVYSGPVAAHAYALLRGRSPRTVVLVGPSHRHAFEGVALFPEGEFETPLGRIPVDAALASALEGPRIRPLPRPHAEEHSLEMQLPFLQRVVEPLAIVPLLMGSQTRETVDALASSLAAALRDRDTLLVASSDLSHYHPAPVARSLDETVIGDVERFDPDALMSHLEANPGHACGGGPMVSVLKAARALGAERATILRYGDSGDAGERDKTRVVGYLAAALLAP
jgi:AmmeMemoRadiSam system protein B